MSILIALGEKSAENYASLLVDKLENIDPELCIYSICGNLIEKKTKKIADYRDISVIGFKEAMSIVGKALKLLKQVKRFILDNNIDLIVLIDFPEFNIKLARFAKKHNVKVVYYINPKVWAWRSYRMHALFKYSDAIIPILPFEKSFFSIKGMDKNKIFYFGHPIIDLLHNKVGTHKKQNLILIMPGSRKIEIENNAPVMFEAAKKINDNFSGFEFVWVLPDEFDSEYATDILKGFEFISIKRNVYDLMDSAYFGILKSGTTTLEAAIFALPMVVVYKLSKISYFLGKILINNVRFISLPNIISGKMIVKELIEDSANADTIYDEFVRIHSNKTLYNNIKNDLMNIAYSLGEYPVTDKIAKKIYSMV